MFNTETMMEDISSIAPLVILWVTACVVLLGDVFLWKKNKNPNPLVSLLGVLTALAYTLRTTLAEEAGGHTFAFAGGIALDQLANVTTLALLATAFLSILMAWTYLQNRNLDHGEYYVLLLLSISGAMLMASASDLIVLFLGLEILSFALYVMAGFARTEEKSEEASLKYFLLGAFASAFFLYGIALIYGATQTTNLPQITKVVSEFAKGGQVTANPMLLAGIALILVGLGFKAALVPFHQWTPDVYEGAPMSVTGYMAGGAKIGAFVAMIRVFSALIPVQTYWITAVQVLAVLTMIFGNLLAVTQTNVKRMLAYSSIAHAGYLLVAVAALTGRGAAKNLAMSGAVFYLFAYTFMTLGSFGVLIYLSNRRREVQTLGDLRGLVKQEPLAAYTMMFFLLSLGGIPPTMGFMGKWQIFLAAVRGGQLTLAIVMGIASVIAVFYYLKVVYMMCFEEPLSVETVGDKADASVGRVYVGMSVAIAAACTVLFGLLPNLILRITTLVP